MILGYYLREQQAKKSITTDNGQKYFPRGNHKEENPATSLEIELEPKVKPKDSKMIS